LIHIYWSITSPAPLLHSRFDNIKHRKKEKKRHHKSTYEKEENERRWQIFTEGIVRVHKAGDKKIKNGKRRTDDHKEGSKEREGKGVFIQDI
jgi:hypothetical protein